MHTNERLIYLMNRVKQHHASEDELDELLSLISSDKAGEISELIRDYHAPSGIEGNKPYDFESWNRVADRILQIDKQSIRKDAISSAIVVSQRSRPALRWVAAAAIVVLVTTVGYYLLFTGKDNQQVVRTEPANDVAAPNINKAVVRLADGRTVPLDSLKAGMLAQQGGVKLVKLADGQIAYQLASIMAEEDLQYNTLMNPRGSKVINMTLSDGSRVWLNAGSSVTFPIVFIGNERKVTISGEAYFEVAHDALKHFYVSHNGMTVKVLGTHFNVNAYEDEPDWRVTLLEGSVKVMNNGKSLHLQPDEQAVVQQADISLNTNADVEQVMAWKNGKFKFHDTNITEIMRQIARWYDVTVEYKSDLSDLDFGGSVSRQANVSELLKRLSATGEVNFTIEGKHITVKHSSKDNRLPHP